MRVLHVIDSGRPFIREFARVQLDLAFDSCVLACRHVVEACGPGADHHTCVIGSGAASVRAAELGLRIDRHIVPPLTRERLSGGQMNRMVRSVRPDIVHWWTRRFTGGCIGLPGRAWRLESLLGVTPLGLPLWLSSPTALINGPSENSAALAAGVRAIPVPSFAACPSLLRPQPRPDGTLRVLAVGECADPRKFAFLCSLMAMIGVPVVAVLPASNQSLRRVRRFSRNVERPVELEVSSAPLSTLVRTCHLGLWMGGRAGLSPLDVAAALSAGMPMVVPPDGAWAIPEPLRPFLVAGNPLPGELARVLRFHAEHPEKSRELLAPYLVQHSSGFTRAVLAAYEFGIPASGPARDPRTTPSQVPA